MKVILFDLGKTLENNGELIEGAKDALTSIKAMQDSNGNSPVLALISDFDKKTATSDYKAIDVKPLQIEYYQTLENLGISQFFQPFYKLVTLSAEVCTRKPDKRFFRFAIDTIKKDLPFENVLFITEDHSHIAGARQLGIKAIHFKGPGQTTGEVNNLLDIIPHVQNFLDE